MYQIAHPLLEIQVKKDQLRVWRGREITSNIPPRPITTWKTSCSNRAVKSWYPVFLGFMIFKVDNRLEDIRLYGGNAAKSSCVPC